jgi:hypothetical protein
MFEVVFVKNDFKAVFFPEPFNIDGILEIMVERPQANL